MNTWGKPEVKKEDTDGEHAGDWIPTDLLRLTQD